ncbi:MAG TPA: hypothetical protein VEV20_01230 [Burkholderiales bacterium]|nr:hypothetical protein [Burkholderiales bacterium]
MRIVVRQYRLTGPGGRPAPVTGVLGKLVAFVAGTALLVLAFIFSVVLLAALVTGGLALFGYFWWKSRALRKRLRENPPGGHVIEGEVIGDHEMIRDVEVIHDSESEDEIRR